MTVVERAGVRDPARFNAVYARIPDPTAFLAHVRDELSRRLTDTAFAHHSSVTPGGGQRNVFDVENEFTSTISSGR